MLAANGIDGAVLMRLSEKHLTEHLLVEKPLHRIRIMEEVSKLKKRGRLPCAVVRLLMALALCLCSDDGPGCSGARGDARPAYQGGRGGRAAQGSTFSVSHALLPESDCVVLLVSAGCNRWQTRS